MPRHPRVSESVASMPGSPFTKLTHRVATLQGEVYPLHVGDTYLEPAPGARMQDIHHDAWPGLNRYCSPQGHPALLGALERRVGVDRSRLLVTAGATGALASVTGGLLDPGDEVLILSPFWPLIRGIVTQAGAVPIEVDFFLDPPKDVAAALAPHLSERTAAIYVNSPNNPTGRVLAPETLGALAAFAREHDLWLWSDEVYSEHVFEGLHRSVAEFAPERTFVANSFSKAWGMAGNRVGYLVGPEGGDGLAQVQKISTHTAYSAPTAGQIAAARVLEIGADWLDASRTAYRDAGNRAADRLGLPRPEGGTFLFVDVSSSLDAGGLEAFLHRCLDHNLVLAPGTSCGSRYSGHVRVCFTCAPPDVVERGVSRLAALLGR